LFEQAQALLSQNGRAEIMVSPQKAAFPGGLDKMFVTEALSIVFDQTAYPHHAGTSASTADALKQGRYIGRETRQNDKINISDVDSDLQSGGGEAQAGRAGEHPALDGFPS
jgi:hypothetical protein